MDPISEVDESSLSPAEATEALLSGHLADPFALLGPHEDARGVIVRVFVPGAHAVELIAREDGSLLTRLRKSRRDGLYAGHMNALRPYRLRIHWAHAVQETEDPYSFGPLLGDLDLYLLAEGRHRQLGRCLGSQLMTIEGVAGARFAVWAPNARRVSVVGDFNGWDGRRHAMRLRHNAGVWELFIPRLGQGALYKYEILGRDGLITLKADPVASRAEVPPGTASVVSSLDFAWHDQAWMERRAERQSPQAPISVYEVHAGSWQRSPEGRWPDWNELAERLVPYVAGLGFTHIELLPIMEHPFGGSWGYQPLSLFAPTGRYGPPESFAHFVDVCHRAGIGVILDWVPAHFPADSHGLARFDGTALYEHEDPREGFHQDWNTLIYNYGRREVQSFLIASALHWLERYHVDGLRVDAVASMLYRDYSRQPGEWIPNVHGGRENLEAIQFIRELNSAVAECCPGAMMIAEESTSWPGVTRPVEEGGLGFSFKWNMGWMHDTLHYMARDPVHRCHHHNDITFGLLYAFSERFLLPLSHDEVVHMKGSLLRKMSGDDWQRHAGLRAYYGLMWSYPGKKLLFMGGELAQDAEWNHDAELEWYRLQHQLPKGVQQLVGDLNRLYLCEPALHAWDCEGRGFRWSVVDDRANSVYAWLRFGPGEAHPIVTVCNFTPVARHGYAVGVPVAGSWREILNTDSDHYGGSNIGNQGLVSAVAKPCHGMPASLQLSLPPLATVYLRLE